METERIMSTCAVVGVEASGSRERSAFVACAVAFALAVAVIGAGLVGAAPPAVALCAAAFLFLAVASDVRCYRVPNLLTLPALMAALVVSPWFGGTSGPLEAALGAGVGLALLMGPYALGGVGAGDVKALMALGAWLGPAPTLGATAWALIAAAAIGVAMLALRREIGGFARRWGRSLVAMLALGRHAYEPPAPGSAAARGIPFAAALAVGVAVQWLEGAPW